MYGSFIALQLKADIKFASANCLIMDALYSCNSIQTNPEFNLLSIRNPSAVFQVIKKFLHG